MGCTQPQNPLRSKCDVAPRHFNNWPVIHPREISIRDHNLDHSAAMWLWLPSGNDSPQLPAPPFLHPNFQENHGCWSFDKVSQPANRHTHTLSLIFQKLLAWPGHIFIVPALRRHRQDCCVFETSLGYLVRPCLKKNSKMKAL